MIVTRRRGIEGNPAIAREKNFHPRMRVAGAHDPVAAYVVVFSGQKSAHVARGNANRPQHHGHGRRKKFAMSGAPGEKKIGQRVIGLRAVQVQGVLKVALQVQLDRHGFVILSGRLDRDLLRQLFDSRVQLGQLQIRVKDWLRKINRRDPQVGRRHRRNDRGSHVTDFRFVVQRIGQRPGRVDRQFALPPRPADRLGIVTESPFQAPDAWRHKNRIGSDWLHQYRIAHFVKIAGRQRHGIDLVHAR